MLTTNMFIVGGVIFFLYITGLLYMINWANKTQKEDMIPDSKSSSDQKKQ